MIIVALTCYRLRLGSRRDPSQATRQELMRATARADLVMNAMLKDRTVCWFKLYLFGLQTITFGTLHVLSQNNSSAEEYQPVALR